MTIPLGDRDSVLSPFLLVQRQTEAELAKQLSEAARDAQTALAGLARVDGVGAVARRAQYRMVLGEIAQQQQALWSSVGSSVERGVLRAVDAAADGASDLTRIYLNSAGIYVPSSLGNGLRLQARQGMTNVLSRGINGISLSDRVYRNRELASGRIDRIVNSGIINGQSAREIAREVHRFIIPSTPGGASYAAMRLGRSELNNAYHTTTIKTWGASPFVTKLKWNLSGSHPTEDICDSYADRLYAPERVPGKPHPQCFCFLTPEALPEDELLRRYQAGEFDEYLDEKLGRDGLGYPESDRQRAFALTQRRVYHNGRQTAIGDLPVGLRARYLTPEERALVRTTMAGRAPASARGRAVTTRPISPKSVTAPRVTAPRATTRPATPAAPTRSMVSHGQTTDLRVLQARLDLEALRGKGTGGMWRPRGDSPRDDLLGAMWDQNGFAGRPVKVNAAEFDRLQRAGEVKTLEDGGTLMFRGVKGHGSTTSREMVEQLVDGEKPWVGAGFQGNGTYFSTSTRVADGFGGDDLVSAVIDQRAVGITPDELRSKISEVSQQLSRASLPSDADALTMANILADQGRAATWFGYDYIDNTMDYYLKEIIVLNRSALIVKVG